MGGSEMEKCIKWPPF